ncbi:nitrile hydratase subunit alpha [Ruegeria jejuensis]|uniref:nitrile hydratase subunit alpha n=1 Tax=Ruegeria jejuensis TaxID=3233338 RepID=UPI00355C043F
MAPTNKEIQKARFLDKVWSDDAYRARLQADPRAALAEIGGTVPDGVNLRCVMDTDKVKYLHIPAAPAAREISDRDLMDAQGGTSPVCILSLAGPYIASMVTLSIHTENR